MSIEQVTYTRLTLSHGINIGNPKIIHSKQNETDPMNYIW